MRRIFYLALAFLAGSLLATALVNAAPIDDPFEAYQPAPFAFDAPEAVGLANTGTGFTV